MSMRTEDHEALTRLVALGNLHVVDPETGELDDEGANRNGMVHDLIAQALEWDAELFARARIVLWRGGVIEAAGMATLALENDIRPGQPAGIDCSLVNCVSLGAGAGASVRITRPALEWFVGGRRDAKVVAILDERGDAIDRASKALIATTEPQPAGIYFMTRRWLEENWA